MREGPVRVLVVDDDDGMRQMLGTHLDRRGFEATHAASAVEALAHVEHVDIVVADVRMPVTSGIELCAEIVARRPRLPVILITAFGSMDTAIEAMRAGAFDFVPKPFRVEQLVLAIERGVPKRAREIVGASPVMTELDRLLDRIADSDASVLVTGETGTGKELVVRALHERGPRRDGPLVALNCAAMPAPLLESELFGHARGAFTDARDNRTGLLAAANGGTVFLDEVGELPPELQPKLLRALQERRVRPVGATSEVAFDARIVSATNRDLATSPSFRRDLLFRLDVISVAVPPLRARAGDVELLATHFLERFATRARKSLLGFEPEALRRLAGYAWPGNVRELENVVECAVALATSTRIAASDLPAKLAVATPSYESTAFVTLDELEQSYVRRVLDAVNGNKSLAARILGIERRTLYRMLSRG